MPKKNKNEKINDNQIYLFIFDNQIFIKHIVKNINKMVIISGNNDKTIYPNQYIEQKDINKFKIIGKVVGVIRPL